MGRAYLQIVIFVYGIATCPMNVYAQDDRIETQESAEFFLEEYSDEFQESFFEALKQKGIQNYDKAINLFLECKRLDSTNVVVDHELAKSYFLDRQPITAEGYAIAAFSAEPSNYWYLHTLVEVFEEQGNLIDAIKENLPLSSEKTQQNLALIYFGQHKYQQAKEILNKLKKSDFTKQMYPKINDSLRKMAKSETTAKTKDAVKEEETDKEDKSYRATIATMISSEDHVALLAFTEQALEAYPLQPYFYYAHGHALGKNEKYDEAITVLETGLDYVIDDPTIRNAIYKELAASYKALGNISKANEYLNKIKQGS
ncbi:MAG: hypothetical protein AAGB24_02690 [Bacteroidota bacterium]